MPVVAPRTAHWTSNRGWKYKKRADGYRSGLEANIAKDLSSRSVSFEYETLKIKYKVPEREATYTPDFKLPNGIIVESKGIFDAEDRQKHILIKKQQPHLDIRFVFTRGNAPIYKGSPTTHGEWADKHGFKWAEKLIPYEWILEECPHPPATATTLDSPTA